MSKRRRKRRKRNQNPTSQSGQATPATPVSDASSAATAPQATGPTGEIVVEASAPGVAPAQAASSAGGDEKGADRKATSRKKAGARKGRSSKKKASAGRAPIVPWRDRLRQLLETVRRHATDTGGDTLERFLATRLGQGQPVVDGDRERAIDAFACLPGSAGDQRSLVRDLAESEAVLEDADRDQLLRWEQERRQDVFLLQRGHADRLEAWDPVEGAGLTLHLLDRMGAGQAAQLVRGTVFTCAYLPYMARLVALPPVEFYAGPEALGLYREQVQGAGRRWHDAPAPAPVAQGS